MLYVTPGSRQVNEVYNLSGDCYTVDQVSIATSETVITPTNEMGPYVDCTICESTGCFSGITKGAYGYIDCCGIFQEGGESYTPVCVDISELYSGITISGNQCVPICDEGPLAYTFNVTGTCVTGVGIIEINPLYGTSPYTIVNTSASTSPLLVTQTGYSPFIWNGVSEGSYVFSLSDSSGGINQSIIINVNVEGCFTAEITSFSGTTCGDLTSGQLTVTSNSISSPYQFDLYNTVAGLITGNNSSLSTYQFTSLVPGTYWVVVTDFGGSTAQTNNVVVVPSTPVTYLIDTFPDSPCGSGFGSATVINITGGTPPYTYLWSDGQTNSTATGLTQGNWSVTATDSNDCSTLNPFIIGLANPLGVVSNIPTPADCFTCNGNMSVTISGGTSPYTYQGSNGQVLSSNNLTYILTGLCSGEHSMIVTDAGGCSLTTYGTVISTAGFTVVSVNTINSSCNNNGSISLDITALQGMVTYSITDSGGSSQSVTNSSQSHTFSNLVSDTYTVSIQSGGNCEYTVQKVINNVEKFTVSTTVYSGTCGENNGYVVATVNIGSQVLAYPFDYVLTDVNNGQVVYQQTDLAQNTITVNNLSPGYYQLDVNDNGNCMVTTSFSVIQSSGVNFGLTKTECVSGNNGTATINIFDGIAPFVITWSSNVPSGQSGLTVLGLSGGTYTATVTDANSCTQYSNITLNCTNLR